MEGHLGGAGHLQPAEGVQPGKGAEGLHHGLVVGQSVVNLVDDDVAAGQLGLHVPRLVDAAGAEIALVVGAHVAEGLEVLLGVDQNGVVQSLGEVQQGSEHLILHLDEPQGGVHRLLALTGHNGHRVPLAADALVQDEPVVGAGFGVGLARLGEPGGGHVLPGEHTGDAGQPLGGVGADIFDQGAGVGAAQQLDHQTARRGDVGGIDRLAGDQGHGVPLAHRGRNVFFHGRASFFWAALAARYFLMARSWPW